MKATSQRAKRSGCKACDHPQRAAIDRMILDREPSTRIASMFGMSHTAVDRHKAHVEALVESVITPTVARGLRARVERIIDKLETMADDTANVNGAVFLRVVDSLRPYHELLGRVTGEIVPVQVQAFFVGLGIEGGEDEVRAIVESHRKLEAYSLEDGERDAIDTLRLVLEQHPERADRIRQEVFGRKLVAHDDAVEPSGNGGPLS